MFIITKLPEEDMFQELFLWILNQVLWIPSEQGHSVNFSDQITSFSVKLEPVTTGLKVITLKELNWLTQFLMLSEKKLKDVIAYKDSKLPTLLEEVPDLVWELSWSPKSEKNTQIESWQLSLSSHLQKYLIPSLNHITLPYLSINSSKMPMNVWLLITKPYMISVSELLN